MKTNTARPADSGAIETQKEWDELRETNNGDSEVEGTPEKRNKRLEPI